MAIWPMTGAPYDCIVLLKFPYNLLSCAAILGTEQRKKLNQFSMNLYVSKI